MDTNQKRTNGFVVLDVEVLVILDCVSPNAERLYRKLLERMNHKRGDKKVFPSWKRMQEDCRFSTPSVLSRTIKELEHFRLISVDRPDKVDQINNKAHNTYFITDVNELPTEEVLQRLSATWEERRAEMSAKEKARKEKYEKKATITDEVAQETEKNAQEPLSQTKQATITDEVGLLSQTKTNHAEVNHAELTMKEQNFEKISDNSVEEKVAISVQEVSSLQKEQHVPVKTSSVPDPNHFVASCIQEVTPEMVFSAQADECPAQEIVWYVYEQFMGDRVAKFDNLREVFPNAEWKYLDEQIGVYMIKNLFGDKVATVSMEIANVES